MFGNVRRNVTSTRLTDEWITPYLYNFVCLQALLIALAPIQPTSKYDLRTKSKCSFYYMLFVSVMFKIVWKNGWLRGKSSARTPIYVTDDLNFARKTYLFSFHALAFLLFPFFKRWFAVSNNFKCLYWLLWYLSINFIFMKRYFLIPFPFLLFLRFFFPYSRSNLSYIHIVLGNIPYYFHLLLCLLPVRPSILLLCFPFLPILIGVYPALKQLNIGLEFAFSINYLLIFLFFCCFSHLYTFFLHSYPS